MKEWCNTLKWIHTSQSSYSKSFIPVFLGGYFLFHHSPQWVPKYNSAESMTTSVSKLFQEGKVGILCDIVTLQKAISQKASLLTELRLFVVLACHRVSSCRFCQNTVSKLLNENKDLTLWAEFSHKEEVSEKAAPQICLRVVHYSPWDSTIYKISFQSFHKVSVSRLLHERVV